MNEPTYIIKDSSKAGTMSRGEYEKNYREKRKKIKKKRNELYEGSFIGKHLIAENK